MAKFLTRRRKEGKERERDRERKKRKKEKKQREKGGLFRFKLSGPKLGTSFKMKKRVRSGRYVPGKGERIIRIY